MRPMNGIFTKSRRYSRSASSVLIDIACRFGATLTGVKSSSSTPSAVASAPLASISQTSVERPDRAATSAIAAAIEVLPTPPLPVTHSRSRSSSEVMVSHACGQRIAPRPQVLSHQSRFCGCFQQSRARHRRSSLMARRRRSRVCP